MRDEESSQEKKEEEKVSQSLGIRFSYKLQENPPKIQTHSEYI